MADEHPSLTAFACGGRQARICRIDGGEHDMSKMVPFRDEEGREIGGSLACTKCGALAIAIDMLELP